MNANPPPKARCEDSASQSWICGTSTTHADHHQPNNNMKRNTTIQRWIPSIITSLALAGLVGVSPAQDYIISSFDTGDGVTNATSGWKFNGGRPATLAWSPAVDANNNPNSGSMYVTVNWNPTNGNNWQESQITRNADFGWPYINLAPYANLECDIKVDVANSVLTTNLDGTPVSYAQFQPILQQWAWTPLASTSIPNSGDWVHIVTPLGGATTMAQLVLDWHWGWLEIPAGDISYWIDNIKLVTPPQPPPPMVIKPSAGGLQVFATPKGGNPEYQRQMIYTRNASSWVGYASASAPVEYSFTITNFPAAAIYSNFLTQVFWIPTNSMQFGQGDGAVDWNTTNNLVFAVGDNADGTAYASLAYKTNAPSSNPTTTIATLGAAGVFGKWSVIFSNNTDVTLLAPDGAATNATIPAEVASVFVDWLTTYVGIFPNKVPNVGQKAVYSRVTISGTPDPVDDSFATLDSSVWGTIGDATGIKPSPADTVWQLNWTAPAIGATLQQSSDLANANSWVDSVPLGATTPTTTMGQQFSYIPASALPAANQFFFRLVKQAFTKLQVLMPGETAAPGTPTGKTGTPTAQTANVAFNVTVNAVDANWNVVDTVSDTVRITSSDGSATLPPNADLVNGVGTFEVVFGTGGSTQTVTATDVTDGTKAANIGSPTPVNP